MAYINDKRHISDEVYAHFAKKYNIGTTLFKKLPRAIWEHEAASNVSKDGLYYAFDEKKYTNKKNSYILTPANDTGFDEEMIDSMIKKHGRRLPTGIYAFSRIERKKELLYSCERDNKTADGRYFNGGTPQTVTVNVLYREDSSKDGAVDENEAAIDAILDKYIDNTFEPVI